MDRAFGNIIETLRQLPEPTYTHSTKASFLLEPHMTMAGTVDKQGGHYRDRASAHEQRSLQSDIREVTFLKGHMASVSLLVPCITARESSLVYLC